MFLLPFWLLRGKAHLKACLADKVSLDVSTIPVHEELLVWLRSQHMEGRTIMLCTGANYRVARLFADSFGIFKEVIASSDTTNYSGIEKQKILEQRFGLRSFDYIGNSSADTHVWSSSRKGILVSNDRALAAKASAVTEIEKVFPVAGQNTSAWLQAVRLHQWAKNLLLFVPLFAAHRIAELESLVSLWTGFIAFGLCASGVYVFNDLIDLGNDRLHPRKKSRPFAYASLNVRDGLIIAPLLLIFGFGIATFVSNQFFGVLATYVLLTFLYTLWLKRLVLIDCIALAALYCLRILAGAVAVSVPLSFWLLAFSGFLFLSLGFLKRYTELLVKAEAGSTHAHGRGYSVSDKDLIQSFGIAAGFCAVLVFALYLNSDSVLNLYKNPSIIWATVPLVLLWIARAWLVTHRGEMNDDPVVFALKDRISMLIGGLIAALFTLAALW
jgi:4-hydroxybenzoate polyprenyltransferase